MLFLAFGLISKWTFLEQHRNPARQSVPIPWEPPAFKKMGLELTFEGKILRHVAVGLFILTIVQLLLLLILALSWRIIMEPPPLESSMHCLICNNVSQPYPYNDLGNVIDARGQMYNESVCCDPIREVMERRIQNEMTKQFAENRQANPSHLVGESFITDCEWQGLKTPTAKLVGVVDSVPSDIVQGNHNTVNNVSVRV
ncbi:hypothetical protein MAR_029079 [Mya arenaria]|uniref:Uncharacterized protein n=1 Tax=Mya arenaria TaxID=6604 RepID=A0ABY7DFC5_MYAAR|nr:hypothetical protein MAR_029079 [Mya arenaria]